MKDLITEQRVRDSIRSLKDKILYNMISCDEQYFADPLPSEILSKRVICDLDLSPSQKRVAEHFNRHRCTVLFGPPGTGTPTCRPSLTVLGKTETLAKLICGIVRSRDEGRREKIVIGVTAFTKASAFV